MLLELDIQDFAIIDHLRLEFSPGLCVLTGETGAGKSIIMDALGAALGDRMGPEAVREGAKAARVEATFQLPTTALPGSSTTNDESPDDAPEDEADHRSLPALLTLFGIEAEDGLLVFTRDIAPGRAASRINGRLVPAATAQRIGRALVDMHGQTDHLSLLRPASHVDFLDRFGGLEPARARVAELYDAWRATGRERAAFAQSERDLARRLDLLTYQIDEISAANLVAEEETQLADERRVLQHAERLAGGAAKAHDQLVESGQGGPAATDAVSSVARTLADLVQLDARLQPALDLAAAAAAQLGELADELRRYANLVDQDPGRLAIVDDRLDLIRRLEHKYGATVADVLAYLEAIILERDGLEHHAEREAELAAQEERLARQAGAAAAELSQRRQAAAADLESAVDRELAELAMGGARLELQIDRTENAAGVPLLEGGPGVRYAVDRTGIDRVEFLIAPNRGEPARPLVKIASGGEMSRLLLALKSVLSAADATPVLVFDEVDVGVGGRLGSVLGEKLAHLAETHQVLTITHLPQVAAYADQHDHVRKVTVDDRTVTRIERLEGEARVRELAAMLGGKETSQAALASATELCRAAQEWKQHALRGAPLG